MEATWVIMNPSRSGLDGADDKETTMSTLEITGQIAAGDTP